MVGATSYEDLRTVRGVIQPSFREAAEKRALMEEDNSLDECLSEAATYQMPSSLRRFLQQYWYFVNRVMYSHFGKNTWMQCLRIIVATIHQMLSLSIWS